MLQIQYKTRAEFIERYNTNNTKSLAVSALNSFDAFILAKYPAQTSQDLMQQLRENEELRYLLLDNFTQYLKIQGRGTSTIKTYLVFVVSWLRTQGAKISRDDLKDYVSIPKAIKREPEPLTIPQIRSLINNADKMFHALFVVLACSGMRISELLQLTPVDIDFESRPAKVTLRAGTTKTKERRITFLSSEARELIKPFCNEPNKPIFDFGLSNIEKRFSVIRKRAGLDSKYDKRNFKTNIHSFRSFFRTQAGQINQDTAEALMGHKGYLGQYRRPTEDELKRHYREIEPLVTIHYQTKPNIITQSTQT